jgi:hypothetical protein
MQMQKTFKLVLIMCILFQFGGVAFAQQEKTVREPVYTFVVEKRRFFNEDAATTGTVPLQVLADLEESGWSPVQAQRGRDRARSER